MQPKTLWAFMNIYEYITYLYKAIIFMHVLLYYNVRGVWTITIRKKLLKRRLYATGIVFQRVRLQTCNMARHNTLQFIVYS
jgi:hypothetical protein